jgi:antitoxin (DNA-binding transcriptional repressor) of toxin-antitoxin stability system
MAVIGIRDLSRKTREVFDQLEKNGEPVIVARHGKPVAILSVPTKRQLVDADIAATPGFRGSLDQANRELAEGTAKSFDQFVAEVEAEEADEGTEATTYTVTVNSGDMFGFAKRKIDAELIDPDLIDGLVKEALGEALVDVQSVSEEVESLAEEQGMSQEERRAAIKGAMAMRRAEQKRARAARHAPVRGVVIEAHEEIA